MAKTKISEFSTTAGNNTDINSINIAEGCAPSGINDAIRELMRQLKEFQTGGAGDSVNSGGDFSVATNKFTVASASGNTAVAGTLAVTGTTTLTGALVANGNATLGDGSGDTVTVKGTPTLEVNPTLSGGTANGVLYLNGSKVATSGSALTFDGASQVTLNGSTTNSALAVKSTVSETSLQNISNDGYLNMTGTGGIIFRLGSGYSEGMRLTSTGLGIGTSSPGYKMEVVGSAGDNIISLFRSGDATSANNAGGGFRSISSATASSRAAQLWLDADGANFSGGDYFYIQKSGNSGNVEFMQYSNAAMLFSTNATERMRIDSSGNLGLGVTPSAWVDITAIEIGPGGSHIGGYSAAAIPNTYVGTNCFYDGNTSNWKYKVASSYRATRYTQASNGEHQWYYSAAGTAGNTISFTQAMTLDASGRLGIGTTSPANPLDVKNAGGGTAITCRTGTTAGGNWIDYYNASNSRQGIVGFLDSTNLYIHNDASAAIIFDTNNTERARIDSSGRFLVYAQTAGGLGVTVDGDGGSAPYIIVNSNSGTGAPMYFRYQGTTVGTITTTTTATAYNTSSDYRLKDNQQPLTGSGAFIDALQPKTWNWKADGSRGVGFIAHEVQAVSPGSVVGEKDGEQMQAMEYGSAEFIANIIAELQSLRARVAQLESN
jgi:hypothetical protein